MNKIKIGKDDVIGIDENSLPRLVRPHEFANVDNFSKTQNYKVIGITWILYPDRTRSLGYILINEKETLVTELTDNFMVVG